ncbi:DNA gyrase inhibitor YacG [Neisseria lactamica]|uniref:DNA gyrase inhibitor YacG n=1 Tax=Neisseria lactamica TaxID=486 RepID=UPI000E575951|nr:DNA gyrase inhibitor YacG [Neisseria lactamica]
MAESRQTRLQVKCPTCQTAVVWESENAFRPFCSQRCKLIDLGGWADEEYTVTAQEEGLLEISEFECIYR